MRQLDRCDFCGEPPEGAFEVVPASVADGPVRLALCGDCRTTLGAVVDPLLDAGGGTAPTDGSPAGGDAPDRETPPAGEDDGGTAGASDGGRGGDGDGRGGDGDGSGGDAGVPGDDADGVATEPDDESPAPRPEGYGQVLRVLQNRDGAIPRDDLRALARNAYDIAADEYEAVVDAAVENGDIEATEEGLRTA